MVKPPRSRPPDLPRRLAAAADLRGNADGEASLEELAEMQGAPVPTPIDGDNPLHDPSIGRRVLGELARGERAIPTLDPALRSLPAAVRRLALEVDGLWGNADGQVSAAELDRIARYYLAALPFFAKDAHHLMELAEHLGYFDGAGPSAPLVELRAALARVERSEVDRAAPFRLLFDEAIAQAEVPGAPEMLRHAAEHSPRWHRLSILEHTATAVRAIATLCDVGERPWKDAAATMLLHDIGKILVREARPAGEAGYTFHQHTDAGADWLRDRGLDPTLVFHIRHHTVLRTHTAEEMIALYGGHRPRVGEAVLIYIADQIAKGDTPDQLLSFKDQREKLQALGEYAGLDMAKIFRARQELLSLWFPTRDADGGTTVGPNRPE